MFIAIVNLSVIVYARSTQQALPTVSQRRGMGDGKLVSIDFHTWEKMSKSDFNK